MKDLMIFENKDFGEIRGKEINNKPWVCLADVCKILDIKNARDCKSRLNKDGVVTTDGVDSKGRKNQIIFINESNLYKVIFQSRKPEAEKFTEWVTGEVLPAIRQTGAYIAGEEKMTEEELIQKAFLAVTRKLEEREKLLQEQKPKVVFADSVATTKDTILVSQMAVMLKQNGIDIGEKRLFKWLRNNGYLVKEKNAEYNRPTQKSMDRGLFKYTETTIQHNSGEITIRNTPRITGKGQIYFVNKFKRMMEA